jgi:hypothetical protein
VGLGVLRETLDHGAGGSDGVQGGSVEVDGGAMACDGDHLGERERAGGDGDGCGHDPITPRREPPKGHPPY